MTIACAGPPAPGPGAEPARGFRFVDVAPEVGMDRVVLAGRPGKDHLLDSAGSAAAWIDYDRDGWLDAYVANGWRLEGDRVVERGKNALYRNLGGEGFEDVTDRAEVGGEGRWGGGVTVADFDDDGWPDILLTNFGPNVLYRNRGDGTFDNVAPQVGIEIPGWNTGAAFFDADADGDLDLYVAAYIDQGIQDVLDAERTLDWKGVDNVALGPFGLPGAADHFFLAEEGRFVDATERAGLEDLGEGFGFGVRASDLDHDGDQDLYVANDSDANYLYRNEGDGTFRDVGLWSGTALDVNGAAQAGMGVAVGDANGDAVRDIFVTNFSEDFSTLYLGDGEGFFDDASEASTLGALTYSSLSWGTVLADLDNDGDQDIVVANGHIYPQVDDHPEFELSYAQRNLLLQNVGDATFVDSSGEGGPGFAQLRSSRAVAAGDYDNDGDLDLLITHLDEAPSLLRNDSPGGSWLTVVCEVPPGNGTAIGTEVTLHVGERRLIRDLAAGGSFLSTHDPRLHFGLGDVDRVDRVEVRWPDGSLSVLEDVPANRFVTVRKES
jgi:hypothetical protein